VIQWSYFLLVHTDTWSMIECEICAQNHTYVLWYTHLYRKKTKKKTWQVWKMCDLRGLHSLSFTRMQFTGLLMWPHNFFDMWMCHHFAASHVAIIRHGSSPVYFTGVLSPPPLFLWIVVSPLLKHEYMHFNFFYISLSRQFCKHES